MSSSDAEIIEWLNHRTGSSLTTLEDAQAGRELCYFLCDIADSPDFRSRITAGATVDQRKDNYAIAEHLFEYISLDFKYSVKELAHMNVDEFVRLMSDVMSLDEYDEAQDTTGETSNFEGNELEGFLTDLDANLHGKMKEISDLRDELTECAAERDFYLGKLRDIESESANYPESDAEVLLGIIRAMSKDFQPVEE